LEVKPTPLIAVLRRTLGDLGIFAAIAALRRRRGRWKRLAIATERCEIIREEAADVFALRGGRFGYSSVSAAIAALRRRWRWLNRLAESMEYGEVLREDAALAPAIGGGRLVYISAAAAVAGEGGGGRCWRRARLADGPYCS